MNKFKLKNIFIIYQIQNSFLYFKIRKKIKNY
jgi:hypothetical protein